MVLSRLHLLMGSAVFTAAHGLGCLTVLDAESLETATLVTSDTGTGEPTNTSLCQPETTEPCYDGPVGTETNGVCKVGVRTCLQDGSGFGGCVEQVLPGVECGVDGADGNCDGFSGKHLWSTKVGGPDLQRIFGTAVASDGSSAFTGYTYGDMLVGDIVIPPGMFVLKLLPDGAVEWAKGFGEQYKAFGISIAFDPHDDVIFTADIGKATDFGGGLITPLNEDKDVIVKLDGSSGEELWSRLVGDDQAETEFSSLAVDSRGNILVGGGYRGELVWSADVHHATGDDDSHMFLSVLTPEGEAIFSRDYGGRARVRRVAFDASGGLLVTGTIYGVANVGGDDLGGDGQSTSYLARFLPPELGGEHVFSLVLGTMTYTEYGRDVIGLPDGTVVATVPFYGALVLGEMQLVASDLDIGVAAFEPDGTPLWARQIGGEGVDAPWAITATTDGNLALGGLFQKTVDLGDGICPLQAKLEHDGLLVMLDSNGYPLWAHGFGDDVLDASDSGTPWPSEVVMGVGAAPDGEVIIAGEFDGPVDWGGGAEYANPPGDLMIARYGR